MKTVIEMAHEAGFDKWESTILFGRLLERFAELVRADEREACAKVCEVNHHTVRPSMSSFECAAAIRARSNT